MHITVLPTAIQFSSPVSEEQRNTIIQDLNEICDAWSNRTPVPESLPTRQARIKEGFKRALRIVPAVKSSAQ